MNQVEVNLDGLRVDDYSSRNFFIRLLYKEFRWPWKILEFVEFFLFGILGAAHCAVFLTHLNKDIVQNDTKRYPILKTLAVLCPIAGFYGMVFFKLKSHLWINLSITLFLVIIPITILAVILGMGLFVDYLTLSITCAFIFLSVTGLAIYRFIRRTMLKKIGYIKGSLLNLTFLLLCNTLFSFLISILIVESESLSNPKSILGYTFFLFLFFLVFIWIAIHFIVFTKQPNEIQVLKKEIIELESPSLGVQSLLSKFPDLLKQPNPGFFSNYGHILASFSILASTICVEVGVITVFTSENYPKSAVSIAGFYIIAVPCFIFIGTIISASSLNKNDKYCIILLVLTTIPTSCIMWISFIMYKTHDFYYFGLLLAIGFPTTIVYWLSLTMIYNYNKRSYQYFSAICCLITIIPLGLMWPLYSAGGMKTQTFWVVCSVLFFGGVVVLVLWLGQFVFRLSKELVLLIKEVRKFNGYDFAQYLYAASFVFGYCLLGFFTFKRLDFSKDWIGGLVLGCFVIFAFMIFGTVFVHRVNLYVSEIGVEETSIKDIISGAVLSNTILYKENLRKKKKLQRFIGVFGIVLICMISIPLLMFSNTETSMAIVITTIIGLVLASLIFIVFIEIKLLLRQFGNIVISYILSYCWLFCLVPILCLIPISLSSSETEEDLRSITSWSIGSILLIFMFGVSVGSITLNLIFRRLEYEKIAKYCCEQVRNVLIENGVRVKLITLRNIYDNFRTAGPESVEKVLANKTVFYYHDLDKDADLRFSKEILTLREISKIKVPKTAHFVDKKDKEPSRGLSFMRFIRKICTSQEEEEVQVAEELKPEELEGLEMPETVIGNKILDENGVVEEKNWDQQFKDNIENQEELNKNIENIVELDEKLGISYEELNEDLNNIKETHLKPQTLQNFVASKELKALNSSKQGKKNWLQAVFARFSHGFRKKATKPWMNLSDLRHFIRLSGLKPYISYSTCDILYTRLTRAYNPILMTKTYIKLDFKQFSEVLIEKLGRLKFPNTPIEEAENKIFNEILYPNLVSNLQYLNKYSHSQAFIDNYNEIHIENFDEENKYSENSEKISFERESYEDQEQIENYYRKPYKTITVNNSEPDSPRPFLNNKITENDYKNICEKAIDKFTSCIGKCIKSILKCMGRSVDLCLRWLMPTSKSSEEILLKTKSDEKKIISERRESPSWEVICKIIITSLAEVDAEARESLNEKHPQMQFNLSNVIGIIGHIVEIYSFSSVGFIKQVGWIYGSSLSNASSAVLADNDYWVQMYWICFSCSVIYIVLVFPAIKYIKIDRLGLNEDFTVAFFPRAQFFLCKFLSLFGKTLYLTILSAMLSSFSCVYENDRWQLMRNSQVECFSQEHEVYFSLSILSLLIYYPFATLLFPNLAFQNKALDIKFDTTYLVLESQGKVVIAAVGAFFSKERFIWLQLTVSICISGLLFFINLKMKPCLIKSYNLWKTGGFVIPIWVCSCGLVNYYSNQHFIVICLLVAGIGVIIGVLLGLQWKLYGFKCFGRAGNAKGLARGKVVAERVNSGRRMESQSRTEISIVSQNFIKEIPVVKGE